MNLTLKDLEIIESLEDALISQMDGADYDRGIVEEALETANKGNKVLARLIVVLKNKDILNNQEIVDLLEYLF